MDVKSHPHIHTNRHWRVANIIVMCRAGTGPMIMAYRSFERPTLYPPGRILYVPETFHSCRSATFEMFQIRFTTEGVGNVFWSQKHFIETSLKHISEMFQGYVPETFQRNTSETFTCKCLNDIPLKPIRDVI